MLQILRLEKNNYFIFLFWIVVGAISSQLAYLVIPVHIIIMKKKYNWIWIILGFWLILTLSDSRQGVFRFAQGAKMFVLLAISYLFVTTPKESGWQKMVTPFIPFLLVAFGSLIGSPQPFYGFQKTFSYLLLLFVIPGLIQMIIRNERDRFLYNLILIGTIILASGVVLRFIRPSFVIFGGERFSGILGNPNGLGIYAFLFSVLFTVINHYHKGIFRRVEVWFIYAMIIISLFLCGSRGGIFSTALFFIAWFLFKQNLVLGFVAMTIIFTSYQLVMANFVEIVTYLNIQDFFRLETLETGSGRTVVAEIAWKHIHQNYWFSKGFTYSEYILRQYQDYFVATGHQGNIHNSWLTIWFDTGLVGLILFSIGWLTNIFRASMKSPFIWALFFGLLLSISVESWLIASLNPFTIQLIIIITLLSDDNFYRKAGVE